MHYDYSRPVVCLLIEKIDINQKKSILLQRRLKSNLMPSEVDYFGLWELPQGKIPSKETISSAAKRKLKDETSLNLVGLDTRHQLSTISVLESTLESFKPTLCVFDLEHDYLGMGIVLSASGTPEDTVRGQGHKWFTWQQICELIMNNQVFPLNIPIIQEYFKNV